MSSEEFPGEELKDSLFVPGTADPLERRAGSRAGVLSSLVDIAARTSIETGARVKLGDLLEIPSAWPVSEARGPVPALASHGPRSRPTRSSGAVTS